MSAIDVLFFAFYCFCGMAAAKMLAARFGAIYGLFGFFGGFVLGMILWRAIHWFFTVGLRGGGNGKGGGGSD